VRSYFLNIKAPNCSTSTRETERQIRGLPARPEKAEEGVPVIIFFTRWTRSSNPRHRHQLGHGVDDRPQLLAEIDASILTHVIVIAPPTVKTSSTGDPSSRPPGLKIKIERPDADAPRRSSALPAQ